MYLDVVLERGPYKLELITSVHLSVTLHGTQSNIGTPSTNGISWKGF